MSTVFTKLKTILVSVYAFTAAIRLFTGLGCDQGL